MSNKYTSKGQNIILILVQSGIFPKTHDRAVKLMFVSGQNLLSLANNGCLKVRLSCVIHLFTLCNSIATLNTLQDTYKQKRIRKSNNVF